MKKTKETPHAAGKAWTQPFAGLTGMGKSITQGSSFLATLG
jgi:hypothetical protein